jgi:protein O-mannosyl-transferase
MGKARKPGSKPRQPIRQDFLPKAHQFAILVIINCILFLPSLRYEFIGLDDTMLIVLNADYLRQPSSLVDAFKHDAFYNPSQPQEVANVYYRPLLTISFMWDAAIGGQGPFFYHLTNLFLHIANCILILGLFSQFAIAPAPSFWGSLFFAIHPLLAQAVCWIPGRNDSLLALFVLSSLIFFMRYLRTYKFADLLWHGFFFAFGLFTKETAIATPFIAYAYFLLRDQKQAHPQRLWWPVPMYLIVLAIWVPLRAAVVSQAKADLAFSTLMGSFFHNFPVYFQVLQKLVVPLNLSLLSTPEDTNYVLLLLTIFIVGGLFIFSTNVSWKRILFGFLWFNAFLLPAFLVHILTGFEHRVYLPLVGFLIMLFETDILKKLSLKRSYRLYSGAAFLALLFTVNLFHVRSFKNGFEFWRKAAENSPHSSLAKLNYGVRLAEQGKLDQALETYQEGLRINPGEPKLHNNVGIIYARTGKRELAESEFKREIELNPRYSDAYFNLGVLYGELGDRFGMQEMWLKALEIDPNHTRAKKSLNDYLMKQNRPPNSGP